MTAFSARRAILTAVALAPFFVRAATEGPKKRLAIVGFTGPYFKERDIAEFLRILGERGFAPGGRLEVVRVDIEPAPEGSRLKGLDYLVPVLEREVLPVKPDVIFTMGSILTKGLHMVTRRIPIVASVADPVDLGVAESLARPGGNVTGLSQGVSEVSVKAMEMTKAMVPRLSRIAIFFDPRPVATRFAANFERAAKDVGLEPVLLSTMDPAEYVRMIRGLPARRIQAAFWAWGGADEKDIAREAIGVRVPMVAWSEGGAEAGFLASYSSLDPAPYPKLAAITAEILRGADPAGIPFQFPQAFRFVINRRTAKALGLALAPDLLVRADRVIG